MLSARVEAADLVARNVLVERFLPPAHPYQRSGEPTDDLVQVASLALVRALDRYDPALGNRVRACRVTRPARGPHGGLAPRSREVPRLRYEQDMTQTQIGELLGVNQMHVSRLIHQALTQMRHTATSAYGPQPPTPGQLRALA